MQRTRAPLEGVPRLAVHGFEPAPETLDTFGLLRDRPERLLAARAVAVAARERLDEVVDERDGLLGRGARLAQTRLAQRDGAVRLHQLERSVAGRLFKRVRLFPNAADTFERERDPLAVVAHAGEAVAAPLRNED